MQINKVPYPLIDISKPDVAYLILESYTKEKKSSKGIILIHSLMEEPIKLGRGHQCDIRIGDISVSRLHALIKYENS
jgi:pSer/pThr/pTyr-binding forkhead associated (FHA) protein